MPASDSSGKKKSSSPANFQAPRGVQELMAVPAADHDKAWLQEALQNAIQLELATIPPYRCAWWSVINPADPVAATLKRIAIEEMMHLGLAANMLNAIAGTPKINSPLVVPKYPGEMPGGVHPGLPIALQGLTLDSVKVFMEIEKPDFAPVVTALDAGETYATIGDFYNAIESAFVALDPAEITGAKQVVFAQVTAVTDKAAALAAIKKIREEGEGTQTVPTSGTKLAHYYRFGEILHGKKAVQTPAGWKYSGAVIPFPAVYPVATVPAGGYPASLDFDKLYTQMLGNLQLAWTSGVAGPLSDAVDNMRDMTDPAQQLMQTPLPLGGSNYCPSFILVP